MGHALADIGGDASLLSVMQATSAAGHAAAVAYSQASVLLYKCTGIQCKGNSAAALATVHHLSRPHASYTVRQTPVVLSTTRHKIHVW